MKTLDSENLDCFICLQCKAKRLPHGAIPSADDQQQDSRRKRQRQKELLPSSDVLETNPKPHENSGNVEPSDNTGSASENSNKTELDKTHETDESQPLSKVAKSEPTIGKDNAYVPVEVYVDTWGPSPVIGLADERFCIGFLEKESLLSYLASESIFDFMDSLPDLKRIFSSSSSF